MERRALDIDEGSVVFVPAGRLVEQAGTRRLTGAGEFRRVVAVQWIDADEPGGCRAATVRLGFADESYATYDSTDRLVVAA